MDGKTFEGWKISTENPDTWLIIEGAFVAKGPRSHLFYHGDGQNSKNFHLKIEVNTEQNANGSIFFHTEYQEKGWPVKGFENQVNVSHKDWKKREASTTWSTLEQSLAKMKSGGCRRLSYKTTP